MFEEEYANAVIMTSFASLQANDVLHNKKFVILLNGAGWSAMPNAEDGDALDSWREEVGKPLLDLFNGSIRDNITIEDIYTAMDSKERSGEPVLTGAVYVLLHKMFEVIYSDKKRVAGSQTKTFKASSDMAGSVPSNIKRHRH